MRNFRIVKGRPCRPTRVWRKMTPGPWVARRTIASPSRIGDRTTIAVVATDDVEDALERLAGELVGSARERDHGRSFEVLHEAPRRRELRCHQGDADELAFGVRHADVRLHEPPFGRADADGDLVDAELAQHARELMDRAAVRSAHRDIGASITEEADDADAERLVAPDEPREVERLVPRADDEQLVPGEAAPPHRGEGRTERRADEGGSAPWSGKMSKATALTSTSPASAITRMPSAASHRVARPIVPASPRAVQWARRW